MSYKLSFYETQDWIETSEFIKGLYGRKCMKCGKTEGHMHTDHIIPRSINKYLELEPNNLQILCKKCNLDKGNSNQIDYRTEDQKKRLERELKFVIPTTTNALMRLQRWVNKVLVDVEIEDMEEFLLLMGNFGINLHEP